ncbi:MAG: bifunctional 4-hydroxy-3-methylbut-2-enyl diphosphate reductase/30S ribosomal protein S1 [Oscillospiraceae bacterium]|jgi:4-hydroxy-3-methylbut-2-enyl diphosphate reductase|nr:bifunctional 4-hydroxy-3-methylbut-2-enyl diphosphate reductase/30S ribosomal protein S1 [Oscillospiraceae bacterium]
MKLILAENAGFCFGVNRAVELAAGLKGKNAKTIGPIIHNKNVIRSLEKDGIGMAGSVGELEDGATAVICSHGAAKEVYDELERRGMDFVDATCPFVKRIHTIAREESSAGRLVIIIGDGAHTEIKAICTRCDRYLVFKDDKGLEKWLNADENNKNLPISLMSQTTMDLNIWENTCKTVKKQCTNFKTFGTICSATSLRQEESAKLAEVCDAVIVIGDRQSANTRRLYELCLEICGIAALAEDANDIPEELLQLKNSYLTVGITAGASTPKRIIEEVMKKMNDELKDLNNELSPAEERTDIREDFDSASTVAESNPEFIENGDAATNGTGGETADPAARTESPESETEERELSFEELLDQSFKTLTTGEKVTGIITGFSTGEIYLDLGTKHAGYIPMTEISEDATVKAEDIYKVGDEIEAFVVRVNDVEGTAMLSKKRLDTVNGWENVEEACENKATMEGTVIEDNKGGVVAVVKGVRVFIPSSQTGVPKDGELSALLKKKVKLKITEVNRARRRVVGSIRLVDNELNRERAAKVWDVIEVGMKFGGVVKSMTSYGVFVDIGGVDGMAHISELSWQRVKHPSEVCKVGDEVEVYVISFDPEKKKISLGIRNPADNPWARFTEGFNEQDIIKAKVVKLMPFGAFAEVIPGVDGLIHISQISDKRIGKPGDALSEGQVVDCKITSIDNEKQKVWLSIRALIEQVADEKTQDADAPDTIVAVSEEGSLEIDDSLKDD